MKTTNSFFQRRFFLALASLYAMFGLANILLSQEISQVGSQEDSKKYYSKQLNEGGFLQKKRKAMNLRIEGVEERCDATYVSNADYIIFLNLVAAADSHGLYDPRMAHNGILRTGETGSYFYSIVDGQEDFPVTYISFLCAARYCNWLENNQASIAMDPNVTEHGAYELLGDQCISTRKTSSYLLPEVSDQVFFDHFSDISCWGTPDFSREETAFLFSEISEEVVAQKIDWCLRSSNVGIRFKTVVIPNEKSTEQSRSWMDNAKMTGEVVVFLALAAVFSGCFYDHAEFHARGEQNGYLNGERINDHLDYKNQKEIVSKKKLDIPLATKSDASRIDSNQGPSEEDDGWVVVDPIEVTDRTPSATREDTVNNSNPSGEPENYDMMQSSKQHSQSKDDSSPLKESYPNLQASLDPHQQGSENSQSLHGSQQKTQEKKEQKKVPLDYKEDDSWVLVNHDELKDSMGSITELAPVSFQKVSQNYKKAARYFNFCEKSYFKIMHQGDLFWKAVYEDQFLVVSRLKRANDDQKILRKVFRASENREEKARMYWKRTRDDLNKITSLPTNKDVTLAVAHIKSRANQLNSLASIKEGSHESQIIRASFEATKSMPKTSQKIAFIKKTFEDVVMTKKYLFQVWENISQLGCNTRFEELLLQEEDELIYSQPVDNSAIKVLKRKSQEKLRNLNVSITRLKEKVSDKFTELSEIFQQLQIFSVQQTKEAFATLLNIQQRFLHIKAEIDWLQKNVQDLCRKQFEITLERISFFSTL